MYRFCVFVCYSHEDKELARAIVEHLEGLGLFVMWDRSIEPGRPFTEAIKTRIARAHVFMPLLTPNSIQRPWVHQETGYATGMEVPVLPLAVGQMPDQMIQQLQAIELGERLSDLTTKLTEAEIDRLVLPSDAPSRTLYECADHPERRTELIGRYARWVREHEGSAPIRQSGAFSSFCIPDQPPDHPIWSERDGWVRRGPYYRTLLWHERLALEEHARAAGCRLILDPTVELPENGPHARRVRLQTLVAFLNSMSDEKLDVAIRPRTEPGNRLLVGDWFSAESLTPRPGGYRQTVFTWHAPSVLRELRHFDRVFQALLRDQGLRPGSSRAVAIQKIQEIIDGISD